MRRKTAVILMLRKILPLVDPCVPKGTTILPEAYVAYSAESGVAVTGEGNSDACLAAINDALVTTETSQLKNAKVPSLLSKFLATENFFYPRNDLGFALDLSKVAQFEQRKRACASPAEELTSRRPPKPYCFALSYHYAFLSSVGVSLEHVRIAGNPSTGIDWSVGAALVHIPDLMRSNTPAKTKLRGSNPDASTMRDASMLSSSPISPQTKAIGGALVLIFLCVVALRPSGASKGVHRSPSSTRPFLPLRHPRAAFRAGHHA